MLRRQFVSCLPTAWNEKPRSAKIRCSTSASVTLQFQAPDSVAETIRELADMAPAQLHAYSAAQGLESTRAAIAENLNKRFGTHYTADNLYLTMGAAACLSGLLHGAHQAGR